MSFERATKEESQSAEPQVLSVSDINKAVRATLEGEFPLLWVKGEISNFKPHSSGHWYFSLKDSKAQINAVMFRGFNQGVRFRPADGMEVLVRGKITVYEPRGTYQMFCELMEPVGAGALQIAFEKLKAKLQAEGLFDPKRKRQLPAHPAHVAVVTSPTGAAVRDILNVLGRRFRGLRVTIVPAVVQGDQAPASIVAALDKVNRLRDVDVVIVGRGGGSMEDLWAFNDESVARAIAACRVPTISAVGHEVDFTIADFVADLRAPTPSAAAELVVKNAAEMIERVAMVFQQVRKIMAYKMEIWRRQLSHASQRLVDPKRRLQDLQLRCDELTERLGGAAERLLKAKKSQVQYLDQRKSNIRIQLEKKSARLSQLAAVLDSLSPLKVLVRGFSITARADGQLVRSHEQVTVGDKIQIRLAKGKILGQVIKTEKE